MINYIKTEKVMYGHVHKVELSKDSFVSYFMASSLYD